MRSDSFTWMPRRLLGAAAALTVAAVMTFAGPANVEAQQATITGTVLGPGEAPVATANVQIQAMRLGAITDDEGNYTLEVPASRVQGQEVTVTASALGYRSASATVTLAPGTINQSFTLQLDPIGLEEIVATGLGTERRREQLGRTVNTVSAQEIEDSQNENIVAALAGKAPNVNVTSSSGEPGAGAYINIRGFKTLSGSNQPIFVVDGVVINNSSVGTESSVAGTADQNRAADINPDNIESIEILKGPAGSAIYGSAGANGVVLITTKSGRAGTTQATLRSSYSYDEVNSLNDLQREYRQGVEFPPGSGQNFLDVVSWGTKLDPGTQTFDHSDEIFTTGNRWDSNLTLSGGSDQTTYFLSGGYTNNDGFIRGNSAQDKASIRLKASHAFLEDLTITGNVAYTNQALDLVQQGSNTSGLLLGALRTPPEFNNLPYLDPETGLHRSFRCNPSVCFQGDFNNIGTSRGYDNPFWISNEILNTSSVDRTFGNVRIDYEPFNWLSITNTFGADYYSDDRMNLFPKSSATIPSGRIIRAAISEFSIDNNLFATLTHEFNEDIGANLTLGQNVRQDEFQRLQTQGDNLIFGATDLESTVTRIPSEFESRVRTIGYFGELNLDLYNQLYLTGGLRYDGFSTFGQDKRRFWFPSANVAWEFSRLEPFADSDVLDYGKLRVAYGEAGQDPPVFSNVSAFQTTTFTDGWIFPDGLESIYGGQTGVVTEFGLGNENINPEVTKEFEVGIDLAFLENRIGLGATYYDQQTEDAILNLPIAPSRGAFSRPVNGAEFSNEGFELTLDLTPVQSEGFRWNINTQFGTNNSNVENLLGAENFFLAGFVGTSARVLADEPFGVLYGDDWMRFGRGLSADVDCNPDTPPSSIDAAFPSAQDGEFYIACDGFPRQDPRQRVLGDPNPDYSFSVRNTFQLFGNFRISGLVDVAQDKDMWNGTRGALYFFGTHAETAPGHGAGQEWTFDGAGPGSGTEVTRNWVNWYIGGIGSGFTGGTPLFIEDASFVKLRDLSLRYTVDQEDFLQQFGFDRAEVSVTGRNLATWTDYRGLDPESNLTQQSTGRGLEYFNNPQIRSWVFQVTLVR